MITNSKNWHNLLWLTSFLITTGAWANLESHALAQSRGTLTVNTGALIIREGTLLVNPDIVPSALNTISDNADSSSLTTVDSVPITSGGNITLNTGTLILRRVPERSSLLGLLAFAVVGAALMYKRKQKSRYFFRL
jgi:hypothetical protein